MRLGMIRNIDFTGGKDLHLTLTIQLPSWVRLKDMKEMAVTKNNKTVVRRNRNGRYVPALNPRIKEWYKALVMDVTFNKDWRSMLDDFKQHGKKAGIKMYAVGIYWFMRNMKIDCHNYTEFLMDGIQAITEINDCKYMPLYLDKQKSDDGTNYVIVHMKKFKKLSM